MVSQKCLYNIKDLSYSLELWHSNIKKIQGHFGSSVASYFIFLRWLLYLNILNFVLSFGFIVTPHLIHYVSENFTLNANESAVYFSGYDFLTGSGWIGNSAFYYGRYTNKTIEFIEGYRYDMPMAYIFTVGVAAIINLFVVAYSVTTAYQKTYVASSGEVKEKVCGKVFCAWDFNIEKPDTADLRHKLIYSELKELLSSELEKEEKVTCCAKLAKVLICILVNAFIISVMVSMGYLVYFILDNRAVEVSIRILRKMTLALTVTAISFVFHYLVSHAMKLESFFSKQVQLYLALGRVAVLRLVILSVLVYFWMVIYMPKPGDRVCYENHLGEEIYRLIVVNFLMNLLFCTLFGECLRNALSRWYSRTGKKLTRSEFDVAYNTNDLIYYQTLVWVGAFYGPMLPLLFLLILVLLFYIKMNSVIYNCRPSQKPWSATEAQTVFLVLTLTNFLLAGVAVAYIVFRVKPSASCGPFRTYKTMYSLIPNAFTFPGEKSAFHTVLYQYIGSPASYISLVLALAIAVYYARAHALAHEETARQIRDQLIMESKDKILLLRLFESAYREHVNAYRSQNEAANRHGDTRNRNSDDAPQGNAFPHEVINEAYVDYHQQTNRLKELSPKARYNPGYLMANVPANNYANLSWEQGGIPTAEMQSPRSGQSKPKEEIWLRRDSEARRNSNNSLNSQNKEVLVPRPIHKKGFRYLVNDESPS